MKRDVDGDETLVVDIDIPMFKKEDRSYIDSLVFLEDNN